MDSEYEQDDERIYHAVVAKPHDKWAASLGALCQGDNALRARVETLLECREEAGDFLEKGVFGQDTTIYAHCVPERAGILIGRYRLLERIGEGGFGSVWAAEQREPVRRRVALKVVKLGMDTRQVIARFEAERQALALMDHPNIARVLDAGTTETGRPYFVMELVKGVPITTYCCQEKLGIRDRLVLFIQVCHAIQHAHQKGIIHRDIKPSNIMVALHDGVPVPKVIDFGIAKATQQELTEKTVYTQFQQFIGTPEYISPELAGTDGLDIDTRSDIYSLGVLLYELLTGTTPFEAKELTRVGLDEMRKIIREREPTRPSTRLSKMLMSGNETGASNLALRAAYPPIDQDLDWIVMKCLEKDRARRYETANNLAADVERFLDHKPVSAAAPNALYRFRKFARRHKAALVGVGAVAALLVFGSLVSVSLTIRAVRAEHQQLRLRREADRQRAYAETAQREAEAQARAFRRLAYASDMHVIQRELSRGNLGRAREILYRNVPHPGQEDLRGWEWRYLWQQCQSSPHRVLGPPLAGLWDVSVSHDGRYIALSSSLPTEKISVRAALTGEEVASWNGTKAYFSPAGPWLVYWSKGEDPHEAETGPGEGFRIWNAVTRKIGGFLPLSGSFYRGMSFCADGKVFAVATTDYNGAGSRQWVFWKIPDGGQLRSISAGYVGPGSGYPFAIAEDMSLVAHGVGGADRCTIRVFDLTNEQPLWESPPVRKGEWVETLELSPDGSLLAVGLGVNTPEIQLWDARQGRLIGELEGHSDYVRDLLFLPDSHTLVSASADQSIRLWDLHDLDNLGASTVLRGHEDEVARLDLFPDGKTLVSGGRDGSVFLWDTSSKLTGPTSHFAFPQSSRTSWAFTTGQVAMIGCDRTGRVSRWTGPQYRQEDVLFNLGPALRRALVYDEGRRIVASYNEGPLRIWDVAKKQPVQDFAVGEGVMDPVAVICDDTQLLVEREGEMVLLGLASGEEIRAWSGPRRQFSVDGRISLRFTDDNLMIWADVSTGAEENLPKTWKASGRFGLTSLSSDGRYVAASTYQTGVSHLGYINVYDIEKREKVGTYGRFLKSCHSVAFSPDAKRLIGASSGIESVKIWDFESQQELMTLETQTGPFFRARFTADGNAITATSEGGMTHCWCAPAWEVIDAAEASYDADTHHGSPAGMERAEAGLRSASGPWDERRRNNGSRENLSSEAVSLR